MTFQKLFHGREEAFYVDRFALEGVEPCVQYPPLVPGHHRRGHGHNGNPPSGNLGSQPSERLDPVDPGQPNVHQDQAWAALLGEADTLFSRLGLDNLVALERQHVPHELSALVVVLDDKDQLIRHGAPAV